MSVSEVIRNEADFDWYKKKLDVDHKYSHHHSGKPTHYPCKVVSEYWDDPNGACTYYHSFVYQQRVQCEHCGHEKLIWPELPE